MDYLHYNPVKHGLTIMVKDWSYSTFHRYMKEGVYDENWAGDGVVSNKGSFGE
jgi:putative transposase